VTGTRPEGQQVSLLIVDDHRMFAEVLAMRLQREPGVREVRAAFGLDEARVVARQQRPDVVVLDYNIDGRPGSGLIADLRTLPDPPFVVMLSASEAAADIIDSLESGASAWVVKGSQVDELMLAVNAVLQGRAYLHPSTVRSVIEGLLQRRSIGRTPTFVDGLSARQVEVLQCLVAGLNRGEVAQRLFVSPNTVRTHVQHLLEASGEHSTLALVARAREIGVRGIDDETAAVVRPSSP
jgi:DNA-binding NarL/FixJ family response regulator